MNETRKQIIELIEPYMDKTLSFGCYIKPLYYKEEQDPVIFLCELWKVASDWESYKYCVINKKIQWSDLVLFEDKEIIWHYDITAILKYIWNKNPYFTSLSQDGSIVIYKTSEDLIELKALWFIGNKPLHLFSDTEEKELLELLLKLK